MNDAISREAVHIVINSQIFDTEYPSELDELERLIDEIPALDVVPVVRCGQCKWYDSAFYACSKCGVCVNRDFYCADGERSDDHESCP